LRTRRDLSELPWKLSGWTPHLWRMDSSMEIGASPSAEVPAIPARVPGSVQLALKEAGLLPDWNSGLNARLCEWVENRHWVYETVLPDDWLAEGTARRVLFEGLDGCGSVWVNGVEAASFGSTHLPLSVDITAMTRESGNVLRVVFETPPRWLGQFGYTSRMTAWKARFNYTWDWVVRLVQIGMHAPVVLEASDGREIERLDVRTSLHLPRTGEVEATGAVSGPEGSVVRLVLQNDGRALAETVVCTGEFNGIGARIAGVPVEPWQPNGNGAQPLYGFHVEVLGAQGELLDSMTRRVGFRHVCWEPCEGAPPEADPWICAVNGQPVFLQGVNWTPIRPNFADLTENDYRKRLELYRDMGVNLLRVWGGATLESECFYDICDELGLMVWQEFPLSSSGVENLPPSGEEPVNEMAGIAESYIRRRAHHPSLIVWCGGNELQDARAVPCDTSYPMLARLAEVCAKHDPGRRFLATSSSGPRFCAAREEFGKGVHWDVHGPWKCDGSLEDWRAYWEADDALFRSEAGAPGASPAGIIRQYAGDCGVMPCTAANPLWRRGSSWWIEWDRFVSETGREGASLDEYVEWSQQRQKQALVIAADACKRRFPRCGGFLVWMGHDCFPCSANTAIVDYHGNPKPAAPGLAEVFRQTTP